MVGFLLKRGQSMTLKKSLEKRLNQYLLVLQREIAKELNCKQK